jgi:hypothetical protein
METVHKMRNNTGQDILPTFLGIGAQKSGTTAVHQFLLSHPQIFLPVKKELCFFAFAGALVEYKGPGGDRIQREVVRSWEEYKAVFRESTQYKIRGEISPQYLLLAENAAPLIFRYLPRVKLFAVLRNPVDRAYSNFLQAVRLGREPISDFKDALRREPERIREKWPPLFWYKRNGQYHRQLAEFYSRFPKDQIRIYLYDDLRRDTGAFMADLYRYLGADSNHHPDYSMVFNPSGTPRHQDFYGMVRWVRDRTRFLDSVVPLPVRYPFQKILQKNLLKPAPPMPPHVRQELKKFYLEEIIKLQDLIGRDLGIWLAPEK